MDQNDVSKYYKSEDKVFVSYLISMYNSDECQCTNDMTFFISADTDNHRYNPIFISADTDKLPIQFFLYRPIPIPITDITSFIIYIFFIMITRKIILK